MVDIEIYFLFITSPNSGGNERLLDACCIVEVESKSTIEMTYLKSRISLGVML